MTTHRFTSNAKLAAFIGRTAGKFAVQAMGADVILEVFAEKGDLVDRIKEQYGDPQFYVIKRDEEDHHVLVQL